MIRFLFVCAAALALLTVPARSDAALFTATYSGQVGSGDPEPLLSFPVGTAISFEVIFDDIFLFDDDEWFFNVPRATTGVLTVGGVQTQLTSYNISAATFVGLTITSMTYSFSGVGPLVAGAEFYRLEVPLLVDMTLKDNIVSVGYDYNPNPFVFARYVESAERPYQFDVTPVAVPAPALGWLMLSGLGAVAARRLKAPRRSR